MSDTDIYREIDGRPILWDDGKVVHRVEGGWGPQSLFRLLWTDCEIDVPDNKGYTGDDKVTCKKCLLNLREDKQDE